MFPMKCYRAEPCKFRTFSGRCFLTECVLPKPQKEKKSTKRDDHIVDTNKKA